MRILALALAGLAATVWLWLWRALATVVWLLSGCLAGCCWLAGRLAFWPADWVSGLLAGWAGLAGADPLAF